MPITEQLLFQTDKSSHRRCSIKKLFVKISQYSRENTCTEVFLKKSCKCEAPTQMFYCEYCEISKNTYFEEHLRTAASEVTLGGDCLGFSFWTVALKIILT